MPHESYSEIRKKRKSKEQKKKHGESMFRILYITLLIIGVLVVVASLIFREYLSLLFTAGINIILFSFAFKFAESVIALLKEIHGQIDS